MSTPKPLNDILEGVDEPEESPDHPVEPEAAVEQTEEPPKEAEPEKEPEPAPATDAPEDENGKTGLPPAIHARVKASTEAKRAAEAEAAEWRRKFEELSSQNQPPQGDMTVEDYVNQRIDGVMAHLSQQEWNNRVASSHMAASEKYGADTATEAAEWAKDRMSSDPGFAQQITSHPAPTLFAVEQYRRQQTLDELDKYGGDMDKLIEAKMAERASAPAEASAVSTQPPGPMPGDFATTSSKSGSGRTAQWSGPTPLSELLK